VDRFRDLERTGEPGRKNAALLAAIAGYEALRRPSRQEQHRFSELFTALFEYSSPETQRVAAAALCRLTDLPDDVVQVLASSSIDISAPFLAFSPELDDDLLIALLEKGDPSTARIIKGRQDLSLRVSEAVEGVERRAPGIEPPETPANPERDGETPADHAQLAISGREEELREALRALVRHDRARHAGLNSGLRKDPWRDADLIDTALEGDRDRFLRRLAERLGATVTLADRIMMDHSGRQLAMVFQALDIPDATTIQILQHLFPQLGKTRQGRSYASLVLGDCDPRISRAKVEAWRQANRPKNTRPYRYQAFVDEAQRRMSSPPSSRPTDDDAIREDAVPVRQA
jgi:uncharacterized protein (DUF2336 family)